MSDEERNTESIPEKYRETLRYYSHVIRQPFAKAMMWVLYPVLGPMLGELEQLSRMVIQRSVHFSDVQEGKDGNVKFLKEQPRYRFVSKEE